MIITLVRRCSLALLECWDLPLDRRETELLLARRLQVMGADLGLVPPGPARQRLTCFGYSGPPAVLAKLPSPHSFQAVASPPRFYSCFPVPLLFTSKYTEQAKII
jgi:hypothetical protein